MMVQGQFIFAIRIAPVRMPFHVSFSYFAKKQNQPKPHIFGSMRLHKYAVDFLIPLIYVIKGRFSQASKVDMVAWANPHLYY